MKFYGLENINRLIRIATENKKRYRFFVKSDYKIQPNPTPFIDAVDGLIYQPDVYSFAGYLAEKFRCRYLIDIGCGNGNKLAIFHPRFEIIGIDFGVNLEICRCRWPFGTWLEFDLEQPGTICIPRHVLQKAVIICADVIEHLRNPTFLFRNLRYMLNHSPVALISTPERDLVRGINDTGPPANLSHVREWNTPEFEKLLHHFGFNIEFIGLTVNNNRDLQKKTILAVVGNNKLHHRSPSSTFKVVAFMTTYNEEDIIFHAIKRLVEQEVEIYVIDNWSTDNTYNILIDLQKRGYLLGLERYPPHGPQKYYQWRNLLSRIEDLSCRVEADWFIHHDADEIRNAPWHGITLREGIWRADRMGFSAIDHSVLVFWPVDNGFQPGSDFGEYFRYFEFGRRPGHFLQVKAWKNIGYRMSLADSGGHEVRFENRHIFPYNFLLRHYPIRSQHHGDRKVFVERKGRWDPAEREIGWHTQYDSYEKGDTFLRRPEELKVFNEATFFSEFLVERLSRIGIVR